MDADRMPGDAEALGAAAAMRETYGGRTACGHQVGDEFWFQATVGQMPQPGRLVEILEDGRLRMAAVNGQTFVIGTELVAEF